MTLKRSMFVILLVSLTLTACAPKTETTPTEEATSVPTAQNTADLTQATVDLGTIVPTEPLPIKDEDGKMVCEVVPGLLSPENEESIKNYEIIGPVTESDNIKGPDDAKLTIIEYSDFQCPYCSGAWTAIEQLVEAFPGEVRVVFRHLPLKSLHPNATLAAQAAEAAGNQGKFWEMGGLLFTNQSVWSSYETAALQTWLEEQADALELDVDQFKADLNSDTVVQKVQASYDKAAVVGLQTTPTLFVNGIYVGNMDFYSLSGLMKVYDHGDNLYTECPPFVIDTEKSYTATIETEKGDIVLELYADKAPLAVNSFVFLAEDGYFDDISFHRVMYDFVAQTGDPTGTGWADPGYQFRDEINADLLFDAAGILGMANSGADTNGSQFFITYAEASDLDGSYTIFGKVLEGMDVLNKLTERDTSVDPTQAEGDRIITITIEEK